MSEEIKTQDNPTTSEKVQQAVAKTIYGQNQGGGERQHVKIRERRPQRQEEFEQRMLDVARVTRVMQGGKRMSFRTCVALGDKKGNIGIGLGKGADVTLAVNKAVNQAKKNMVHINLVNETIPHAVLKSIGASKILFKPAKQGHGVKAGGVVRVVLELAGVKNVTSKIINGSNKINNANCTLAALLSLKKVEPRAPKKEVKQ